MPDKTFCIVQKQSTSSVVKKRCSGNMQQIYRRALTPRSDLNKFALQFYWNCFSVQVLSLITQSFFIAFKIFQGKYNIIYCKDIFSQKSKSKICSELKNHYTSWVGIFKCWKCSQGKHSMIYFEDTFSETDELKICLKLRNGYPHWISIFIC